MATQEQLHEAYMAFRIPVGSSWDVIKKRYKVLVRIWHPDRQGESLQGDAEQELKELNHLYQDIFKPHFEGGEHRDDRYCLCQSVPSSQTRTEEETKEEVPPPEYKSEPQSESNKKSEPEPEVEPEIHTTFVWQQAATENRPGAKPVSINRQKDAVVACGVVFIGLCMFSVFTNISKSAFSKSVSSSLSSSSASPMGTPTEQPRPISYAPPVAVRPEQSAETKRTIMINRTRIELLEREIETKKSQISWANKNSTGQLYRELGVKEEELRQLQARTFQLERVN